MNKVSKKVHESYQHIYKAGQKNARDNTISAVQDKNSLVSCPAGHNNTIKEWSFFVLGVLTFTVSSSSDTSYSVKLCVFRMPWQPG